MRTADVEDFGLILGQSSFPLLSFLHNLDSVEVQGWRIRSEGCGCPWPALCQQGWTLFCLRSAEMHSRYCPAKIATGFRKIYISFKTGCTQSYDNVRVDHKETVVALSPIFSDCDQMSLTATIFQEKLSWSMVGGVYLWRPPIVTRVKVDHTGRFALRRHRSIVSRSKNWRLESTRTWRKIFELLALSLFSKQLIPKYFQCLT